MRQRSGETVNERLISGVKTMRAFMSSLARDTRGNVLIITAAMLIPLAGMVGGGIEISRMYIVKTRLQHACDAGALAGRKMMGAGSWAYANYAARNAADQFFKANIDAVPYGSGGLTAKFDEENGKVSGVASANVPMTLMQIFDMDTAKVEVKCDAELHFPNTDVMFVLDNTGSMLDAAPGGSGSKLEGLKKAVKCFYEAIAKVDTTTTCSKPVSGTVDPNVQIRFGFVPYSTNVNVGRILPDSYFARTWSYDTRKLAYMSGGVAHWQYGLLQQNVTSLVTGSGAWPRTMAAVVGPKGTSTTVTWDGCIEEAKTDPDPIANPSLAKDLNIDLVPNASDPETLLGPAVPKLVYKRQNGSGRTRAEIPDTTDETGTDGNYYCPATAIPLQQWPTAAPLESYVDALIATGNTYHDIGLLWGGRLASPDGMFSATNKSTASGQPIARHLIFMTDGDTNALNSDYAAYGLPWYDQRNVSSAGYWGANFNNEVNIRFMALCQQIKDKNITLWVVSFGNGVSGAAQNNLKTCSTPGHYYSAVSSTALEEVFNEIAGKIAELRIVQ